MQNIAKNTKCYIPRTVKNHYLFGTKYIKSHLFVSNKWDPTNLTAQYKCMVDLIGKCHKVIRYENIADRKKKMKILRKLKKQCRKGRQELKDAIFGNAQMLRNLLQNNREMQRLYQMMPTHLVVENINQRTFVKRKERDRLKRRRELLTKKYESKLLALSKLEDVIKYQNEFILIEGIAIKKYRKYITNSKAKIRAMRTISRAYNKIIYTLRQDAIHYEPILDSLQHDMEEQSNFISQVINLGLPAIGKFKKLTEEYNKLEEKTRKKLQDKIVTLTTYKDNVRKKQEDIKMVARTSEDFKLEPSRYNRETDSMLELKTQLEHAERVIKQVKYATLSSKEKYIYPSMKKLLEDNSHLPKELSKRENERNLLQEKELQAKSMQCLLQYNLTDEEIDRVNTIQRLRNEIKKHKAMQKDIDDHIIQRGEIFCQLRFSLDHISDTLRHVGKLVQFATRTYPDSDLKLPLLKFELYPIKSYPPDPFDYDASTLLQIATDKVKELMNAYKEEKSKEELQAAKNEYHAEYLLKKNETLHKESDKMPFDESTQLDRIYPHVLNRNQIKAMSAKIVEENLKKDD